MTLASDQNKNPHGLSSTSQRMIELRPIVFAEWENRVRATVKEAAELSQPLLIDTLPTFYDGIAEAITPNYPRATATDGNSAASEHGGERARLSNYGAQALIHEYQIFRQTVFDVLLQQNLALTPSESLIINASIDDAIREAVMAFSLVHSAMREQFMAALTHDLRTPLNAANIALELLLLSTDPAQMKTTAVKAMDNLKRVDEMIRTLLDSMANQGGQRMPLQLTHFDIAEVVKEVQVQVGTAYRGHLQIFGGSVKGWWDRDAIGRVIDNLVGNAAKYGNTRKPIRISYTEAYGRLILMVHNEGDPIPLEEQACIFQIFRRAQGDREGIVKGWGIGLPFVRGVAESHGGSIVVDSAAGRGTTFTLDIPTDVRPLQDAPAFGLT